ncbi:synaptotagmin-like protein 2 isoform X4 [Haplochromis burtoni]|uniref:synaptotagmin-like protein 2 isoform X4 n=1 Tax=Haplochromis burtoni TaxID=8153 RepID=UPI0003BD1A21|nr:synaptotagmin-like protein 2 isoform X4 [Haplochromis burtoni]
MSGDPAHPAAGVLWRRTSNRFHTCPLRKAGEGTMIDLSHLTEEEQAMIMTVLKRDAELKKAEEERVRKLEDIVNNTSQSDAKLKYLTGEWFYEAKSRRHRDKIHGSEIILASMKQGKAASLDGSLRLDRPKVVSSRASDIVPPLKPARQLEAEQPQQISDAEKENQSSGIRSPRMPRHNPFNRASLVVVEPPENNHYLSASRDQESLETEPVSPLKNHPAGEANQTSEGSSVGFRPVPKKRTFLSRRPLSPSESNGLGLDAQPGSAGIIPTPRWRLQRGSSGSSNQSGLKSQNEMPQRSAVSNQVARSSTSADENSLQSLCDNSQVSSNSSLERQRNPASITRDRVSRYTRSDASTETGPSQRSEKRDDQPQRELPPLNFVTLPTTNIQDKENNSRVGPAMRQEELSLPQNIVGENDDGDQNPVRKALRRAEARPKNLAKSMEDITASLSPRQERRQDSTSDLRRVNDASVIASPSSALFSDPDHLKKMSKSVPSFLQKEDPGETTDSTCEDSYPRERLIMGSSMSNLTISSGRPSVSSLSGSVMTMYSADFANVEVQGSIQFSINYVQRLREFHIFVAECRDLAAVDPKRGRSDPYVKSYLAPDKANLGKRKTSVKKKTLNPTFNEILRYRVRMEYLRTQTLILSVWHHDTFGKNSFLGEVDVELSKWDFDHTQMNYLALKARTTPTLAPSNDRGEMKLAIRFLPQIIHSEGVAKDSCSTGEIHIWVKECKNLPLIRATIDPYVKCFVLPDTSRKSRQKTRVLRRTVDPVFNHTMVYDGIREADLTEACVELTVWDRDRLASNLLGGLRLGTGTGRSYGAVVDWMDSSPYEVALWERMMATPNEWVEAVLPLRMLNSAKTAFK